MNRRDKTPSYRVKSGFTLIEVLVVVAIIALLISILLPSLKRAREEATGVVCRSNMHQLMLGMHAYVAATRALPGTNDVFYEAWRASGGRNAPPASRAWRAQDSWLGILQPDHAYNTREVAELQALWTHVDATVPKLGSLYSYVREDKAYLCPKDKKGQAHSENPAGGGGNGRFSYTMNGILGFKRPEQLQSFRYVANFQQVRGALPPPHPTIPAGTVVKWPESTMVTLMEEHPWNNTNHGWVGDSIACDSYLALRHDPQPTSGRCNFAYLDGHADTRRYPFFVQSTDPGGGFGQGGGWNKLLGADIFNEFRFPYDWAGMNQGGAENSSAFAHKFPYPY